MSEMEVTQGQSGLWHWRCWDCAAVGIAFASEGSARRESAAHVCPDVEAAFSEFWQSIVMPDGEWDLAQVKRELHDYRDLLHEVPLVYSDVTGGMISKPNTSASAVIAVADGKRDEWMLERVREEIEAIEDEDGPQAALTLLLGRLEGTA